MTTATMLLLVIGASLIGAFVGFALALLVLRVADAIWGGWLP